MSEKTAFFQVLQNQTLNGQLQMLNTGIIHDCMTGEITQQQYIDFLTQAYHHVKHTVPLLMACGSRLPDAYEWLRMDLAHYIEEEKGHHLWILNDIAVVGGDTQSVAGNYGDGKACQAIELMTSYLYHQIDRGNPMALLGMVWVLEGTSVNMGGTVANLIQQKLKLPDSAMSYLVSHSALDLQHIKDFEVLVNKIDCPADRQAIIDGAKMVYSLYGQMLQGLSQSQQKQVQ